MGTLFGGMPGVPQAQPPPTIVQPPPMPVPDKDQQRQDELIQMARKDAASNVTTRRSTIIGANDETLG